MGGHSSRCHSVIGCGVQLGFQCSASPSPLVTCTLGACGGAAPSSGVKYFSSSQCGATLSSGVVYSWAFSAVPVRHRVRCTLRALIEVPLRYKCGVQLGFQCSASPS